MTDAADERGSSVVKPPDLEVPLIGWTLTLPQYSIL